MKERKIKIGRQRYIVYVDTDDQNTIDKFAKELKKATSWWKFWNKFIVIPKGPVKIYRL